MERGQGDRWKPQCLLTQMETAMPVNSSWMPYAPQGVKGFDDDDVYIYKICILNI